MAKEAWDARGAMKLMFWVHLRSANTVKIARTDTENKIEEVSWVLLWPFIQVTSVVKGTQLFRAKVP